MEAQPWGYDMQNAPKDREIIALCDIRSSITDKETGFALIMWHRGGNVFGDSPCYGSMFDYNPGWYVRTEGDWQIVTGDELVEAKPLRWMHIPNVELMQR